MNIFSRLSLAAFVLACAFFAVTRPAAASTSIATCADLQAIGNDATGVYELAGDIDCNGFGFTPLSNFRGELDGNGYAIDRLSIFGSNYQGLFTDTNLASIHDLSVTNAIVYGNFQIGILASSMASTTVTNVVVQGGLSSSAALSLAGGVAGVTASTTLTNVYANVTINGFSRVGGLIGTAYATTTIDNSFSAGALAVYGSGGQARVGGLVGEGFGTIVRNAYSRAAVTAYGGAYAGGLVGYYGGSGYATSTYAVGAVVGGSGVGGLIGGVFDSALVFGSYWDTETTGQSSSATGTARSTVQMQTQATFAGWDFVSTWFAPSSGVYPLLRGFDIDAPTMPGTPSAPSPTRYPPLLTWAASTDAGVGLFTRSYIVEWSEVPDFSYNVYSSTTESAAFMPTSIDDGLWRFRVRAVDRNGNLTAYATSSVIIVDTGFPVLTLLGSATVTVDYGSVYEDAGATATDAIDGSLTDSIQITNPVNTRARGTYTVSYTVRDATGNMAEPVLRTVIVRPASGGGTATVPVMPVAIASDAGHGAPLALTVNGSSSNGVRTATNVVALGFNADPAVVTGYAVSLTPDFKDAGIFPYQPSVPFVLPSQPGTYAVYVKLYSVTGNASPVLKTAIEYAPTGSSAPAPSAPLSDKRSFVFTRNLRLRAAGNDVRELQKLLNAQGFLVATSGSGSPGNETTYYGMATAQALARFQEAHAEQILAPFGLAKGTGLFMNTTRAFVNAGGY